MNFLDSISFILMPVTFHQNYSNRQSIVVFKKFGYFIKNKFTSWGIYFLLQKDFLNLLDTLTISIMKANGQKNMKSYRVIFYFCRSLDDMLMFFLFFAYTCSISSNFYWYLLLITLDFHCSYSKRLKHLDLVKWLVILFFLVTRLYILIS